MRQETIEDYTRQLAKSFGGVRDPVKTDELRKLYQKKNFVGMARHIRVHLGLTLNVRIAFVKSGGPPNAPAWIRHPARMPVFGTPEFRMTTVTIYLRNDFLKEAPFDTVVFALAHEFAHVVLEAIQHPLKKDEVAVDLAAMLLGFRDSYCAGCLYPVRKAQPAKPKNFRQTVMHALGRIFKKEEPSRFEMGVIGYLTPEEITYAAALMERGFGWPARN
ncbi:MAG: hypothetical protein Q8Q39_00695 [bacterium]|nr:hypothetical protein [bacterium]